MLFERPGQLEKTRIQELGDQKDPRKSNVFCRLRVKEYEQTGQGGREELLTPDHLDEPNQVKSKKSLSVLSPPTSP